MNQVIPNFAQWVFDNNIDQPDKIAIIDDTRALNYRELQEHSKTFAGFMRQQGIAPKERVLLCMDDSVAWPVAFFGCILAGINPVFVSKDLPKSMIEYVKDITDASAIISESNLQLSNTAYIPITAVMSDHEPVAEIYCWHPDEACFWLLSSGSTGNCKCMVHRHANLFYLFQSVAHTAYDINRQSVILNSAKMSFTYGFNNGVNFGLASGATIVVMRGPPSPSRIMDRLVQHSVTHFFAVPSVLNSMIKHHKDWILPKSVVKMVCSTEPLPESVRLQFEHLYQCRVYNGIGMSETTQTYCSQTVENYEPGTMGQPLPDIEMKLMDEQGQLIDDDRVGEIWVKSPCAAYVYWNNWHASKKTFHGHWVKTGDTARRTSAGNYVYVARTDDLIKIKGLFVSPIEIESEILKVTGVNDCAVIVDYKNDLPELHAFITGNVSTDVIKSHLRTTLPSYMIPGRFHFINQLPTTVTFKKQRATLKKEYLPHAVAS